MSKFNKLLNQQKKEKKDRENVIDTHMVHSGDTPNVNETAEITSPIQRRVAQGMQHGVALKRLAVEEIDHSPYQPRFMSVTSQNELLELAENIRHHGQINPILVRPKNGRYELIGGERRLYAIRDILKLKDIDCLIKDISDEKAAITALVDNINRADLSDYEVAIALKNNCDLFGYPLDQVEFITEKFNISRNKYYRLMSLFELPTFIHAALKEDPTCLSGSAASLVKTAMNKAKDQIGSDAALTLLQKYWNEYLLEFKNTNKINTQFIKSFELEAKSTFDNKSRESIAKKLKPETHVDTSSKQDFQLSLLSSNGKKIGSLKCEDSLKGKTVISVRLSVSHMNEEKMNKLKSFLEALEAEQ